MGWLWHALAISGSMTWQILWALILGFTLSAVVQAVVRRGSVGRALGGDSPAALAAATGLGVASSSCSYASVALARSLFRKGASFTAAMTFEIASTNLVIELGIILALLMGWRFTLAEFIGGPIMIVLLAVLFRIFLRRRMVEDALAHANRGVAGSMEGHAAMDMSVTGEGSFWRRLTSARGFTAVSHIFVMEWAAIWRDIAAGLLITGALAAWVPADFWQRFFLTGHPLWAAVWGPLVGPVVAVLSFVCSIGNVPLAAVLWNGGISFGGVVSFIFADLIILPILNIYRKYYGWKMAGFIAATFYVTMVLAGYAIELLFALLHLTPGQRNASVSEAQISWNYTTWLNLAFLAVATVLLIRFFASGGAPMLRTMGGDADRLASRSG
ncbi:permease [Dactylosporangium salmoneum]|uniref:Permease n=1 Tax=Dactylosporangium salmoneum TaxID=53361 RepID=A0ABP5TQA0_9ACTN